MTGFTKDACASLLLGQVWYEQLTDKSKLYLKQLNKEIVQGVSIHTQQRVLLEARYITFPVLYHGLSGQ